MGNHPPGSDGPRKTHPLAHWRVAVSGLEMSQNTMRINWTEAELDSRLKEIMKEIHAQCLDYGKGARNVDYVRGANLAGFVRVGRAMLAHGV